MKKNFKWLLTLVAMVASVNLMWAASPIDSGTSQFTAVSGDLDNNISYSTAKAGGTNAPVINSGNIRLYRNNKNSAALGSTLTLTPKNGATITSVTFTLKSSLGYSYSVDGGTAETGNSSSIAISGISATKSVVLQNNSKDQMDVTRIQVTYTGGAVAKTLESIAVSGTPTKTTYEAGEAFDPAGLVVTGTYDDKSEATITDGIDWLFDPETLSAGTTSCDVLASVGEITSDVYTVSGLTVKAALPKIVITKTSSGIKGSYGDDTFTLNDVTFAYTQWCYSTDFIQAKASQSPSLKNTTAMPGKITKIQVVTGSGKTARAVTVKAGTTNEIDKMVSITSPTTSMDMVFDFGETNYTYFCLNTPSNACYFDKIVIFYEEDKTPAISADVEEIAFDQKELSGTVTDSKVISATGKNLTAPISASMKSGSDAIFDVVANGTPTAAAGEFTVSYSTTEAGEYAGTVVLKSGETSIEIPVSASVVAHIPVLQSIYVKGEPTKKEYTVGDAFETDGLEVWGKYDEGADKQITKGIEWTITPATFSATTETSVSVVATALEKISEAFVVNGLTVNEAPKVIGNWNTLFKTSYNGSISGLQGKNDLVLEGTTDFGVTVKVENHASANGYIKDQDLRLYTNSNGDYTFTVTAPTGKVFKQIVATKADKVIAVKEKDEKGTISVGTSGAMTWTGKANSLVFIPTATTGFGTMTFVIAESAPAAATPTITPSTEADLYWEPITVTLATTTEGAAIYYTTNGDVPTAASTLYEAPFSVSATTTVKAIAVKEGLDNSEVASKTFSFGKVFDNIAACFADETLQNGDVVKISNVSAVITNFAGSGKTVYFEGGSFYVNATYPKTYAIGGTLSGSNLQFTYMNYDPKQLRPASWETLTYTAPGSPTSLNNMNASKKAVKQVVNGQIVIVRDGKAYNVLGF